MRNNTPNTVNGIMINFLLQSGVHHHSSPNSIGGIRNGFAGHRHRLRQQKLQENRPFFIIGDEALPNIPEPEVQPPIKKDGRNRNPQAIIKPPNSIGSENGVHTVVEPSELGLTRFAHVDPHASPGQVQGVDEQGGARARHSPHNDAPFHKLIFLLHRVVLVEVSVEHVLEPEVQGRGGEVPDHVGRVSSPVGQQPFFQENALSAVEEAGVLFFELLVGVLGLEEELDSLQGGCYRFGNDPGDSPQ